MISEIFFENLQKHYNNHLPFVAYRKPEASKVKALLQTNKTVHYVENYNEVGFVFAPFDAEKKAILFPLEHSEVIETLFIKNKSFKPKNEEFLFNETDKKTHIQLLKKSIKAIESHDFKKVVLSRQETVSLSNFDFIEVFTNLLSHYPSAFVYCWYHPEIGLWLGATPETLMKIEGSQFSIMALAGTQEYQGNLNTIWNEKEIFEQQIVTQFIIENLKPWVENLKISEVETIKAGNLLHLKTNISAKLKSENFNLKQIISAFHPTPAVCGMPKQAAKQFIIENEGYDRTFYTGYLGEFNYNLQLKSRASKRNIENRAYTINKKSTQLYVNLRCMQIKNEKAFIYVGSGITKSSVSVKEWEETVSKSKTIKNVL